MEIIKMEEMTKREQTPVSSSVEQLFSPENAFSPDVSIFDNRESLIFSIDVPGVKKGDVQIEIDENNTLLIRAKSSFKEPEGKMILNEVAFGNYFRAFSLSNEFDKNKISGTVENGVLTVNIPRREDVKPKKIQINA
jgi:HSP20 family molecular chaperone IbpA